MNQAHKIWGVVAAAGVGSRFGGGVPKQYLPLERGRVLDYALAAVCECVAVSGVVIGIRGDDRRWRARPFSHAKLLGASCGGESRAHTVLNALRWLLQSQAAEYDWVMVHDAARPCVPARDIERLIAAARAHGHGAVLALALTDALKRVGDDGLIESAGDNADDKPMRGGELWRAATPQMFRCGELADALRDCLAAGFAPPDEAAAMARAGVRAAVVAGHPGNIKITVAEDLELAAAYLAATGAGKDNASK